VTKLFISHKHSDHTIARVIGQFVLDKGRGDVQIHLSSEASFDGPRFGPGLNEQLRRTLWETDALILVYTSDDQDWSYCMWECGLAQHPQSPDTNIIVFQCSDDVPKPFSADLRVDARNPEHLKRFAKQLMTDPKFFPRRAAALAPNIQPTTLESDAKELFDKLYEVLPRPDETRRVQQWPAWPYLRIELPITEVEKVERAEEKDRRAVARDVVAEQGVVVDGDSRVAELFGLTDLAPRHMFKELLKTWGGKFPAEQAAWFDSCCDQIMAGALRQFPVIRWAPLREVNGEAEFTPVLSLTRRLPFASVMQFDIYFYNLSDPKAIPVASRMLREFFSKNVGRISAEEVKLRNMIGEMTKLKRNRLPVLSGDGVPLYIIHRSMIEQFIAKQALSEEGGKNVAELTLADLLADPELSDIFKNGFAVVSRGATLAEAKDAMLKTPNCLDVFVTANGSRDEQVLGWLTNVDIVQSS
jgi:hypothetical protein